MAHDLTVWGIGTNRGYAVAMLARTHERLVVLERESARSRAYPLSTAVTPLQERCAGF